MAEVTIHEIEVDLVLDQKAIERIAGGPDVEAALIAVGQVGELAAKQLAPVDTGTLRRSITHELGQRGFDQYVRIGTNISYAIFQEVGTRFHPAHPFLRPALVDIERFLQDGEI